jgi:hypothetical protein
MTISFSYRSFPALKAYIERIDAKEMNFKRFMVVISRRHYYIEKALITINDDFTITAPREYEPNDGEAENIKRELTAARDAGTLNWPNWIMATEAQVKSLKRSGKITGDLFWFWNLERTGILMCQERRDLPNSEKAYLPWTMWSDGEWRMMEPTGKLPFWKPETTGKWIMIHEGAKTARFVEFGLKNGTLRDHPWYDELREYSHWGMIGGALAPHRANYDELRNAKPSEVVYVCDNDDPGKAAITTISFLYGDKINRVMFDNNFKETWDMADPMPANLYNDAGGWNGPSIADYTRSATWATEQVGDKKVYKVKRSFAKEWCHSVSPQVFVHKERTHEIFVADQFNNLVRPFSNVKETHELLRQDPASKIVDLAYSPAHAPGVYTEDGRTFINTHKKTYLKSKAGRIEPFEEFMTKLIPDANERLILTTWLATLVGKPEEKMTWAILLISESQGTGKTTLCEIAEAMVGRHNASWPSENEIVDSNWTYWCARKRLACISEIYQGHSSKAYNKLKDKITDPEVTVSEKYIGNYTISNWLHIIACSNDMRALKLDNDDRRWFVPTVSEEIEDNEVYWTEFHNWLKRRDGFKIIKHYLEEFSTRHSFQRSKRAPLTRAKLNLVRENYSDGQNKTADLLEKLLERGRANGKIQVTWDEALRDMVRMVCHDGRPDRVERTIVLRKVAKAAGWFTSDDRVFISEIGMTQRAKLVATDKAIVKVLNSDTYQAYADQLEIIDNPVSMAQELGIWDNRI